MNKAMGVVRRIYVGYQPHVFLKKNLQPESNV
jgi:hypothetical protein